MALQLTDITVTVLTRQWNYGMLIAIADMVVASGASYSVGTNAIPVPSFNVFGLRRQLDWLQLNDPMDASAGLFFYRWAPPSGSNCIRVFTVGSAGSNAFEIASGTELAGFTLRVAAIGR